MRWTRRHPPAVSVFAVEPHCAQLVWRRAGPGVMTVKVTDAAGRSRSRSVDTDGMAGSTMITDLDADADHEITIGGPGLAEIDRSHRFRTPAPPPGQLLTKLVTVSDSHVGGNSFGYLKTIRERPAPPIPAAERCLRAAAKAMAAWQPDHVVFKGDIVNNGTAAEWAIAHDVMDTFDCPVDLVLGNHEANERKGIDPHEAARAGGRPLDEAVRVRDLPGVRLVLADTPVRRTNRGDIGHVADAIVDAAADAGGPVLVCLHHNLQPRRLPTFLPMGIPGHRGAAFLDRLVAANASVITVSGHTHRNRCRLHAGIPVVEVGSPKDYPGVWAGYAIHEGGIRQVAYRVDDPECLTWTERTRWAAFGLWGRWSPGTLNDRCFTHMWPGAT